MTRLADWAEPRQNHPRAPFRWVGYDGDAGHGCGNHLHLSWTHADAPHFRVVAWVEVFRGGTEHAGGGRGPTGGTSAGRIHLSPRPARGGVGPSD